MWTMATVLSFGISSFAQIGDHAAPTRSGYAVITPAAVGTELTVMETFALKSPDVISSAGFATPDLITAATIFVDVAERLERNLALAMANPNPDDALVTLALFKDDGAYLGAQSFVLPSHNQIDKFITELIPIQSAGGVGKQPAAIKEYTGTLVITSSVPISLLGIRFRGSMFSAMPVTNTGTTSPVPVLAQGVGGPSALLLPQFAADGGWATQIVITNPATYKVSFRLDLFKGDGSPLTATLNGITGSSFTELSVPPGGVFVIVPRESNGDHAF